MGHVAGRIVSGVAAAVLWIGSFFGAIIALFVAASAAEPGQSHSRGEALAGSLAFALAEGVLVAVAVVLTVYAAAGRFAGWRWLLGVPLGITLVIGALIGLSL
jgi:hypothetical protein